MDSRLLLEKSWYVTFSAVLPRLSSLLCRVHRTKKWTSMFNLNLRHHLETYYVGYSVSSWTKKILRIYLSNLDSITPVLVQTKLIEDSFRFWFKSILIFFPSPRNSPLAAQFFGLFWLIMFLLSSTQRFLANSYTTDDSCRIYHENGTRNDYSTSYERGSAHYQKCIFQNPCGSKKPSHQSSAEWFFWWEIVGGMIKSATISFICPVLIFQTSFLICNDLMVHISPDISDRRGLWEKIYSRMENWSNNVSPHDPTRNPL